MSTKKARDLKAGDAIKLTDGTFTPVTHVRKHRRYAGYMAVQYEVGGRIAQGDYRSDMDVEVSS